jgi:predicted O-methyltransferase YrrM
METLNFIKERYKVDISQPVVKLPIDRFRGLVPLFKDLGFKKGAEIGVRRGMYAKWLLVKIKGLKLFLVDPYLVYDEYTELEFLKENAKKMMVDNEAKARSRLAKFDRAEFIKKTSMDAINDFLDESLDFVFIDGNHDYQYVKDDIREWSKKIRKGGIISGHDYNYKPEIFGVGKAVDEWVEGNEIKPLFILKEGSWFYVK